MKTSRLAFVSIAALLAITGCSKKSGGDVTPQPTPSKTPTGGEVTPTPSPTGGEVTPTPSPTGGSDDYLIKEDTEITIWTTYNDTYQAVINNAIDEFKTIEPKVTIKNIKQQGSYDDLKKMVVDGFAVDNYPDLVAAYPDAVSDFINNAKSLNIQPYMENPTYGWSEEDFADIPETYIALGQQYIIPGTYSLPASKSTEAMYYNQDVLIGLNLSDIDPSINGGKALNDAYFQNLTWEEMFEKLIPALDIYDTTVKKIIDKEKFNDWAYVGYDSDDNLFITLAEQYGYGYTSINKVTGAGEILFDNDGMKGLMKKFKGYYDNHYFTTKGIINTNVNYRSTVGSMLFSIGSTGGVKYQFSEDTKYNVGVAPIPHPEGKELRMISQGPDFAFLNHQNDNRAKASWLFFKLFTNTKYNTAWSLVTGYSPIRYSVLESADYAAYADVSEQEEHTIDRLYALNATYAAGVGDYLFTSPVFKGSADARTQVGTIFAACVNASADLDSKIDEIFKTAVDNVRLKM